MTQLELGEQLRDEAIDQVRRNASAEWKTSALRAVRIVCEKRVEFTTDAVWYLLDHYGVTATHEPRAMGSVMQDAKRLGWIEATDRTRRSTRPNCHARPVRVWRVI